MRSQELGYRFEKNLHKIYLILGSIMCLVFIVLIPPFRIPDEQRHYLAASAIVEGHARCTNWRHEISSGRIELIEKMGLTTDMIVPPGGFDWSRVFGYVRPGSEHPLKVLTLVCATPLYGHAVPALGIMLAEGAGFNYLQALYAGRLFNALFGLIMIAFAIRISPDFKRLFFLAGLFPVILTHFSTVTYDSFVVSSLMLLFANVLRIVRKKEITLTDLIICIPGLAAIALKPFYYPLFFVLSLMLCRNVPRWTRYVLIFNFLFILCMLKILLNNFDFSPNNNLITSMSQYTFFQETSAHIVANGRRFDSLYQIKQILFNPVFFLASSARALVRTFLSTPLELFGYVGLEYRYYFGIGVVVVGLIGYFGLTIEGVGNTIFSKMEKIAVVGAVLASVLLLYAYLFVTNTVVDVMTINGIQGKYFVPHLFFLAMVFLPRNQKSILNNQKAFYFILAIMYLLTLLMIASFFVEWY